MFEAEGGSETDVNNIVKAELDQWSEVSGVMCNKNTTFTLKDGIYKTIVKLAMLYGLNAGQTRNNKDDIWREASIEQ